MPRSYIELVFLAISSLCLILMMFMMPSGIWVKASMIVTVSGEPYTVTVYMLPVLVLLLARIGWILFTGIKSSRKR